MTRVIKGPRGGRHYLVCAAAKAGAGCEYHAVHYDAVEQCLAERHEQIVGTCPAEAGNAELDKQIEDLAAEIAGTQDGLERLLDAIQPGRTAALVHGVREVETKLDELCQRERELVRRKAATHGPVLTRRLEVLSGTLANLGGGALPSATASQDRTSANVLLRQLLSAAVVDWRSGALVLRWKHGGESELQYGWPAEE
jgi:hypothetical protein